ncbi:MAG: hypothetical protein ACK42I_07625 [Thermomicrobium sp.]
MRCPPGRYSSPLSHRGNGSLLLFPGGTNQVDGPAAVNFNGNGTVSLGPRFYYVKHGFSVEGSATVTLAPGTYVFERGAFTLGGNVRLRLQGQPTSCSASGQGSRLFFVGSSFAVQGNLALQDILPCDVLVYLRNTGFA